MTNLILALKIAIAIGNSNSLVVNLKLALGRRRKRGQVSLVCRLGRFAIALIILVGLLRCSAGCNSQARDLQASLRSMGVDFRNEEFNDVYIPISGDGSSGSDWKFTKLQDAVTLLAQLPAVRTVRVDGPQVTDDVLKEMRRIPHLTHVEVRVGDVSDAGMAALGEIKELKEIELSDCRGITGIGIQALQTLPNLQVLDLTGSPLRTLSGLNTLKTLVTFRATSEHLEPEALAQLDGLSSLKELMIAADSIGEDEIDHILSLRNLVSVTINARHGFAERSLPRLAGLEKMKSITLLSKHIASEPIEAIRKLRPDVTIEVFTPGGQ